jgi:pantoate--beta-alanine ligase
MVIDLAYNIKIIECPIIREKNGLAMSSRNEYLSNEEKDIASNIYKALQVGKELICSGEKNAEIVRKQIIDFISYQSMIRIDYVSIANAETLVELSEISCKNILVSMAVFVGETRLIDNFTYSN